MPSDETQCRFGKKLVEDLPGEHEYVHACGVCGEERGPTWVEFHHPFQGKSDPEPRLEPRYCKAGHSIGTSWLRESLSALRAWVASTFLKSWICRPSF